MLRENRQLKNKLETTENSVHSFLNEMGALLDMAETSPNGLSIVGNQFEEVHGNLMGVAAEGASMGQTPS